MLQKESQPLSETFEPRSRRLGPLGAIGLLVSAAAIGGFAVYALTQTRAASQTSSSPTQSRVAVASSAKSVAALGRLEPKGQITRLSAPASLEGNRLEQLLIKEGDEVKAGQVVAILDTYDRRKAALEKAQTSVQVAQARLEQVRSGQSQEEAVKGAAVNTAAADEFTIASQEQVIFELQATLQEAKNKFDRFEQLFGEGGLSESDLETRRSAVETATARLRSAEETLAATRRSVASRVDAARADLQRVQQVNPSNVAVAEAELISAQAAVREAESNLEVTQIRAPIGGKVLKVHARSGEVIGTNGIAEIAQTRQMHVIAQVYKTDINKVKVGQAVTITSEALPEPVKGTVARLGLQVKKQDIFDTNPLAETDNNIVEVEIDLDAVNSQKVATFSNLQVQVGIEL